MGYHALRLSGIAGTVLILAGLLAGCGKKGPLYLPDEASAQHQKSAAGAAREKPAKSEEQR